jgi:hypothetical protein
MTALTGHRAKSGCARLLIPLAGLQLCLLLSGCGMFDHDYNSPEPTTLDFHKHTAVLHFRTVNHSTDTLGIRSAMVLGGALEAKRDADAKLSRDFTTPAWLAVPTQIVYSDTESHACTLEINHFVGYQLRYGGDTSRFSVMDRYPVWDLEMRMYTTDFVLVDGETLAVTNAAVPNVPDAVRADVPYELDITVDLAGLLEWRATQNDYKLQADRIQVRQR